LCIASIDVVRSGRFWFHLVVCVCAVDFIVCPVQLCSVVANIKTAEQRTIIQQYGDGTLAVDGWAVTFGTVRRGWAGCGLT